MTTTGMPSAGWYADPQDAVRLRWWDGAAWSEHTAPVPQPVAVQPAPVVAPVVAGTLPTVPRYGEMATPAAQPSAPQQAAPYAAQPAAQPFAAQPYTGQTHAAQPYVVQQYGMAMTPGRVPEGTPTANWLIWAYTLLPLLSLVTLFAWDFEGYMRASLASPMAADSMLLDPGYLLLSLGSWVLSAGMIVLAVFDWRWLGQQGYSRRFHWAWAILGNLVYVIGRSVVVKRQAGRGFAPMWATIAVSALSLILIIVWFVQMMNIIMVLVSTTPGIVS
jgi:hypothetical protein